MDEPIGDRCTVTAWRPALPGIAEAFHAHIVDWSYPAHSHDTWTVLTVDHGAIDYALDRKPCAAVESTVAILPPGVVHDGRPASRARHGFWKRNLYLEPEMFPEDLVGPAVDRTVIVDPALRGALSRLHDVLADSDDALDGESQLALICERIKTHLRPATQISRPERSVAHRLRLLLDEHITESVGLAEHAQLLDRSVAHLVRSFSAEFGVSPHAYVVGRRIETARRLLLTGVPVADVAVSAGFYDQAHLTRHFKRHVATTPARYAARST